MEKKDSEDDYFHHSPFYSLMCPVCIDQTTTVAIFPAFPLLFSLRLSDLIKVKPNRYCQ